MPNDSKDPIKEHKPDPAMITWSDEDERRTMLSRSDVLDSYEGIQRSTASHRSFLDIETNRSVRTGYSYQDYQRFRGDEAIPSGQKDIINMCMEAYDKVGIIRNVIDLMGDFACQGIKLVHPNKRIERFYRRWFEKINGKERSERFLNTLYRCGNVVVKRQTAKITKKLEDHLRTASAADIEPELLKVAKKEVPWKYDLLNPMAVELVGNELGLFVGEPRFELRLSGLIRGLISSSQYKNSDLLSMLPSDLAEAIKSGQKSVPLDPEKIEVFYYKKDDWLMWANPLIYAILDDVVMLEKMKLADMSALDGAISNIRLWTLGDLDHKIMPTKAAVNKLRNILSSNVGGGTMDLVWGPELDFKEAATEVYRFLGSEKYQPVLTSIYAGLGIPPTLTGASDSSGGGFTNNYVSLKTLVERLEYGRSTLVRFWNGEIERVQKAMGFRFPANIQFDRMVLSDESTEKNLLIQLVDRDLISMETVQERFGEIPEIEKIRINREARKRDKASMPPKASPYHNPQHREDLEKIALGKDSLKPHQIGLIPTDEEIGSNPLTVPDDRPKYDPEKDVEDSPSGPPSEDNSPVGRPEDGRPKLSKDTQKRKQKEVKPRVSADYDFVNLFLWAVDSQKRISDILQPALLFHYDKKNIRSLTKSEFDEMEYIKFCILCNLKPYEDITPALAAELLEDNASVNPEIIGLQRMFIKQFVETNDRVPSIEEIRHIQSSAYATVFVAE